MKESLKITGWTIYLSTLLVSAIDWAQPFSGGPRIPSVILIIFGIGLFVRGLISLNDEREIVLLLRKWKIGQKLTWETLREFISIQRDCDLAQVWSRQSLSSNKAIHITFTLAKKRLLKNRMIHHVRSKKNGQYEKQIDKLQSHIRSTKVLCGVGGLNLPKFFPFRNQGFFLSFFFRISRILSLIRF